MSNIFKEISLIYKVISIKFICQKHNNNKIINKLKIIIIEKHFIEVLYCIKKKSEFIDIY